MKMLFGVWGLTSGGAERVLSVLCSQLAMMGHEVHLYIKYHEDNEYELDKRVIVHRGYDRSIAQLAEDAQIKAQQKADGIIPVPDNNVDKVTNVTASVKFFYEKGRSVRRKLLRIKRRLGIHLRIYPRVRNLVYSIKNILPVKHALASLLDEIHPEIIVPFLPGSELELYLANKGKHIPFIHCVRVYQKLYTDKWRILNDYFAIRADAIFVQTSEQRRYYYPMLRKKAFVLGNPINIAFIKTTNVPFTPVITDFIAVGRLAPQKNYEMMILAMEKVIQQKKDVRLSIYGNGEEERRLSELIAKLNLSKSIQIYPRVPNIIDELKKSHCFLMTSTYEGMPNALMEAMCVGLPCISTDCLSGPRDLIGQNERGTLVPCGDIQAFTNAILNAIDHPQMIYEKAQLGSCFIRDNYSPEHIAKIFEKECKKVLNTNCCITS